MGDLLCEARVAAILLTIPVDVAIHAWLEWRIILAHHRDGSHSVYGDLRNNRLLFCGLHQAALLLVGCCCLSSCKLPGSSASSLQCQESWLLTCSSQKTPYITSCRSSVWYENLSENCHEGRLCERPRIQASWRVWIKQTLSMMSQSTQETITTSAT